MTDFRMYRKPIAAVPCAGGEEIICDDGATFFSFPDGVKPRFLIEGTPVPGTERAEALANIAPENPAAEWQAVAGNLAQILTNTAHWISEFKSKYPDAARDLHVDPAMLMAAYKTQCDAHEVTP